MNDGEQTPLPVCDCRHAARPHEHGTRGMYGWHSCRCTPCTAANREYGRRADAFKPRREMADAAPVRARIEALRAAGLTVAEIAGLSGVHPKVVEFAQLGRNGRLPVRVKASLARALEAITYRDAAAVEVPPMRKVDGDVPRRQIQSLHALGWSGREIAVAAGTAPANISSLLSGHGTTERVRSAVARAYGELRLATPPETTPAERSQAARARNRAAANGWTPDTAGDHEYAPTTRRAA